MVLLRDRDAQGLAEVVAETGSTPFEVDITDEVAVGDVVNRGAATIGGVDGIVEAAGSCCAVLSRRASLDVASRPQYQFDRSLQNRSRMLPMDD